MSSLLQTIEQPALSRARLRAGSRRGFRVIFFGITLAVELRRGQHCVVQITLVNRQRRVRFDADWLRRFATLALAECVHHSGDGLFRLKRLRAVEVAVVSDRVIARVHGEFMGVPGATDVITFDHGEIVVSADTAKSQAAEHGHRPVEEMALYVVHGLLHLNGYDDREPRARARMHRVQDRIWSGLRARLTAARGKRSSPVQKSALR